MRAEWVKRMLNARRVNASRLDTESMDARRRTASNLDAASAAMVAAPTRGMHAGETRTAKSKKISNVEKSRSQ